MTDPHGTPGLTKRSGMISLDLPVGAVPMHPGGVDDHHVTLAYLGPDVDDKALMVAVAATRRAAGEHGPLMLGVGGLGMFPPSDGSDGKTPAYVPVIKTAGLAALRNSVGHLDASGRPDWTPHITLAYLDDPAAAPAPISAREIPMRTITVHRGEDSWSFPLRGSGAPGPAATKVFVNGILRSMELGKVGPKGYIHGWIFVGAPGVGDEVYHPHHGRGTITAHDGKSVTVAFDKGATHRFTAKPSEGTEHHFEPRSGNAVEHGHLADRVARDPKAIAGLKDDELKGVDKELTDRAAALGQSDRVTKTHQKVKDEIARRGATSAGQRAKESVDAERNAEYLKAKEHASTLSAAAKTEKEHAEAAKAHRRAGNLLVDRVGSSRQVIDQRGRDYHEAQYAKHAQAVKNEIARRAKSGSGDTDSSKNYDDLKRAADRYDAGSATGRGTHVYNDPDKQKEAIRLHTAARRAAPDAASKKRHTQEIQRHQQYLGQIENNQNLKDFEQDKEATQAKLKELDRRNYGSDPDVYDQMAAAHNHMADIHQRRAEQMEAAGLGGRNAFDKTVERHRDLAQIHRENAASVREKQEAHHQHVASRMANAEILVGQREGLARQTGKKKDIEHAIAGHEEIIRNARSAGMDDVAGRHGAAAANLRAELARQTTAGFAIAARDKDMQRRKEGDIRHAQRVIDHLDGNPKVGGGPEQREALRNAANASLATGGRGGTAKAHEAAATVYRRYADLAEQGGNKKSADVARDHLATFHDEMAAHIQARRATGTAMRGEFTGDSKKPSGGKKTLGSLVEDAKGKEAHAADADLDTHRAAYGEAQAVESGVSHVRLDNATPEQNARAQELTDQVSKRPSGIKDLSDEDLNLIANQMRADQSSARVNGRTTPAHRAVMEESARRGEAKRAQDATARDRQVAYGKALERAQRADLKAKTEAPGAHEAAARAHRKAAALALNDTRRDQHETRAAEHNAAS